MQRLLDARRLGLHRRGGSRAGFAPCRRAVVFLATLLWLDGALASGARNDVERAATVTELARELAAPSPKTRRAAVKKLAALDTRAAWQLVIDALRDKESEVADEAEVALGAMRDAELARDLSGRSGIGADDPWVRLRVAEAFGRMDADVPAADLARAVRANQPELGRMLLWSVERLALRSKVVSERDECVDALVKLCRHQTVAELRAGALTALTALDRFAADPWVAELSQDRDPAARCAALRAAQSYTEQECMSRSVPALADPEYAVRVQAIENLERLGTRASILALIERMDVEPRARLRWRILAYLRGVSGASFVDSRAWKTWAATIDGPCRTGSAAGSGAKLVGDPRTSFAGMTVVSDRVCFLIDCSGSLWQTKVGDKTRKEIVDEKLAAALEGLPEGTEFNVVPYTSQPIPWEKKLVPSTKVNVKRAREAFERCHATGRGNFFDAVVFAMSDPRTDTVMVLTDGVPTGGKRWNLELMVELLVEMNRGRGLAFDSVLVDAPPRVHVAWAELAKRTAGRSVVVGLE